MIPDCFVLCTLAILISIQMPKPKDGRLASLADIKNNFSECLEHPASNNGADMHKHNTSYTLKSDRHISAPES